MGRPPRWERTANSTASRLSPVSVAALPTCSAECLPQRKRPDPEVIMNRHRRRLLLVALLAAGIALGLVASDEKPPRRRGHARAEEKRPASFPHRIWAACDFEGRTP